MLSVSIDEFSSPFGSVTKLL